MLQKAKHERRIATTKVNLTGPQAYQLREEQGLEHNSSAYSQRNNETNRAVEGDGVGRGVPGVGDGRGAETRQNAKDGPRRGEQQVTPSLRGSIRPGKVIEKTRHILSMEKIILEFATKVQGIEWKEINEVI